MITNKISFEVWKSNYIIVYARKGEINARTIAASFSDADGNSLDLTNKSVTFYALKPDKTQIYNNCIVDAVNGTASIVLTSQMVSVSGIVDCEYQIFEGNNLLMKVSGLKLAVEDGGDFSEAIESTSECNALIEAISHAEEFCESIGNLTDLTTTDKDTLVDAVNEVNTKTIPISQGGTGATTATQARANLEVMTGTWLWSNSSGTKGTITLNDDYSNYDFIYIQGRNNGIGTSNMFCPATTAKISITNLYADDATSVTGMFYRGAVLEFSGTTVTWSRNGSYWIKKSSSSDDGWTASGSNDAGIWLTEIIGYKY